MRYRCKKQGLNIGMLMAAFGAGLIVAFCCPKGVIIAILAVALVILGICIAK